MLDDYHYELRAELHHLTAKIDAARREAMLYRNEIIPRSRQALESAQAAWQSNRDAFRDVLDARRMLLDAQTMYHRAVAEQYVTLSELVLCCGIGDLEALDMLVQPEREETTDEKP
jgi:outer membrane protein TolC